MNESLNKICKSAASISFLVALFHSAFSKHLPTLIVGTALVLITAADAYTWSRKGIPVPHPLSSRSFLDLAGVFSGLAAVFLAVGLPDRDMALRCSLVAAIVYIAISLAYWVVLPRHASYAQFLRATGLSAGSGTLFVWLFVFVLLALGSFFVISFYSAPFAWWAYGVGTWLYLAVYFWFVTKPIIDATWKPHLVGDKT